jgi:uncharacterized protein YggU (UPF0235/DUF167 family)
VSAPPADGQANEATIKLVSGVLRMPPSSISIVRGASSREKLLEVDGLTLADVIARLLE